MSLVSGETAASEDAEHPVYVEDYRHSQRIAVMVRWFLIVTWYFLHIYRGDTSTDHYWTLILMVASLAILNAFVSWRIWKGLPITLGHAVALSAMDLSLITAGLWVTVFFDNTFFVLYYPALLAVSLAFASRSAVFSVVALVGVVYTVMSLVDEAGVNFAESEEKILIIRIATMFAVVAAGNLMNRIERERRREAVEAERRQAQKNLELQKKAQKAELAAQRAAQEERARISREIHDGIAQSIYALTLSLETCADLADRNDGAVREQLRKLVPLAQKTHLESRHYLDELPLPLGEGGLKEMAENQVKEFRTIAGVETKLSVQGRPVDVDVGVSTGLYFIVHEALANILKHAQASEVDLTLAYRSDSVRLSLSDNGVGMLVDGSGRGYGLDNMRERAEELGGKFEVSSEPGEGTTLIVELPTHGGEA